MDDEEDVKSMTDFINKQKSACESNFQLEFQDFVNYKLDLSDEENEDELFGGEGIYGHEVNIKSFPTEEISQRELVFTEEEQDIIDSCTDPELKRLLVLNRLKNMKLIKLYKKMQEYLSDCEEEIEEKRGFLNNTETKQFNHQTCVWKLAAPYFKDKKFFPCPLNEDAMQKRSRSELSVYDLVPSPKWVPVEFDRLTNAVKCNYNINRQNEIVPKMTSLKYKMRNDECQNKNLAEEMLSLKGQLEELKDGDGKVPPLNSNEFINWYKVAETFLKDKHTAAECQSVWHMLVHPEINKSEWTEEENKHLETIAKQHSHQNWDDIARELNTGRTGFTTCLHYFSKLCDKFKKSKFTPEEDRFLLEVVDIYKVGNFIPWNKVVCHFSDRSRHQLYHRYTYFLSQNHVKRGKFSEAEDILLIILVNKFGRNFKKCADYMPHRSQVQLKSRYNSNLQRHIRKGTFTSEDDQIIYEYAQKHGEKSWSGLAGKLTRCNAQIRQRYKLIKTFLRDNPNAEVANIPKRKHRFDEVNESQYNFLNYMADQYTEVNFVPTLKMIEESLQAELGTTSSSKVAQNKKKELPSNSSDMKLKNIDALLTDFFSSSMKMKDCNVLTDTNLNEAAENVEEVLRSLGANLNIPEDLKCSSSSSLDNIDLEILERISKKVSKASLPKIDRLIPPNISTLVGLRSLIIKHKEYKSQQKDKDFAGTSTNSKLALLLDESLTESAPHVDREVILLHQDQFGKRFDALFNWSAILSLEKPNQFDVAEQSQSVNDNISTPSPRPPSKRPMAGNNLVVKKRKISMSTLTNLTQHPQLQLVDKRVVEDLVKKNNISVIRLDYVPKAGNILESILTQPQAPEPVFTEGMNSSRNSSTAKQVVDDTDLQDVETLNVMLKTMKSEANNGSSFCNGEEYQAVKGDVQLLKEILKYEKVKVKPDPDGF